MRRRYTETVPTNFGPSQLMDLRAEYDMARQDRFTRKRFNVTGVPKSGEWHFRTEWQFFFMMEMSRDIVRNNPVIGQGMSRAVRNILPTPLTPTPVTGEQEVNKLLADRWEQYSINRQAVSWNNQYNLHGMAQLNLFSTFQDGDICSVPLRNGKLRLMEAHKLRTPNVRSLIKTIIRGIEVSQNDIPMAYWFNKGSDLDPLQPATTMANFLRISAFDRRGFPNVYHMYDPERVTLLRGTTALKRTDSVATMWEDLNTAKMVQQQGASAIAILRERMFKPPNHAPWGEPTAYGVTEPNPTPGQNRADPQGYTPTELDTVQQLEFGTMITGEPGETLKGFSPGIPNAEYFEQAKQLLTILSINLGLPLAVFLLDMSDHNFNSWRGAMDQARLGFRHWQEILRDTFYGPVYIWKLRQWIRTESAISSAFQRVGPAIFNHHWNFPAWPYIDPLADVQTDILRQASLLAPPSRVHSERNHIWQEDVVQTIQDNTFAIIEAQRAAEALNSRFTFETPLTWKDCLRLAILPDIRGSLPKLDGAGGGGDNDPTGDDPPVQRAA